MKAITLFLALVISISVSAQPQKRKTGSISTKDTLYNVGHTILDSNVIVRALPNNTGTKVLTTNAAGLFELVEAAETWDTAVLATQTDLDESVEHTDSVIAGARFGQTNTARFNFTRNVVTSDVRDGVGAVVVNNRWFYMVGGWKATRSNPNKSDSSIFRADINAGIGTLTQLSNAPWRGRHGGGVEVRNDTIFVFLGDINSGYIIRDVWGGKVNTANGDVTWFRIKDTADNSNRILFASFKHKNWFYYIGGQTNASGSSGADGAVVRTTNFQTGTYQTVATDLPQFKKALTNCGASFNGYIYVVSGGLYTGSASTDTYDTEIWRSSDDGATWQYRGKIPFVGVRYSAVEVADGKLFLIGGYNGDSLGMNRVMYMDAQENWYRITPSSSQWNIVGGRYAVGSDVYTNTSGDEVIVLAAGNAAGDNWTITPYGNAITANRADIDTLVVNHAASYASNVAGSYTARSLVDKGHLDSILAFKGTVSSVAVATGSSGTDINVSGSPVNTSGTITVNVPTASATNRGALSSSDWTTFNNKFSLPSLTTGSALFSNGTTIAQDNTNFFWDDGNNRLGIGVNSPTQKLHVRGEGQNISAIRIDNGVNTFPLYAQTYSSGYTQFQSNAAWTGSYTRTLAGPATLFRMMDGSGTGGNIVFETAPTGIAGSAASFTQRFKIYNNGLVTVGTSDNFSINASGQITEYNDGTPTNGMGLVGNTANSRFDMVALNDVSATAIAATGGLTLTSPNTFRRVNAGVTLTITPAYAGQTVSLKQVGAGTVTIQMASGNIDGAASITLTTAGEAKRISWDGTNGYVY